MAQFIAFDPNVEVNGETILSVVNAIAVGQEGRLAILKGMESLPKKASGTSSSSG